MPQPIYPTLSKGPVVNGYVREPSVDPALRTPLEDGGQQAINTMTRVPLFWFVPYEDMTAADVTTLLNFWAHPTDGANHGTVVVKYTDPTNGSSYFVWMLNRPRCTLETTQQQRWRIEVQLLEALGSYT